MKRLIVYSIYDKDGYIDKYITQMLKSIRQLAETIIVVSNGRLSNKETIKQFSDIILERENIGFDCGAYKNVLTSSLMNTRSYDQIILMNDTFYPWEEVFQRMENEECDCWGLTRKANNFKDDISKSIENYIQTYFLCFNSKIISSNNFWTFWETIQLPSTARENLLIFEIGINEWLATNNYKVKSYLDVCNGEKYTRRRLNPNGDYISEIISECRFPIIKRRAMSVLFWGNAMKAINYVEENTEYDVSLIWENWRRCYFRDNRNEPNILEFKRFCDTHDKLFVYGNGLIGKRVMLTLQTMGYINAECVVTHKKPDEKVKEIRDISFDNQSGIIIAVDEVLQDELINEALKYVKNEQLITVVPRKMKQTKIENK